MEEIYESEEPSGVQGSGEVDREETGDFLGQSERGAGVELEEGLDLGEAGEPAPVPRQRVKRRRRARRARVERRFEIRIGARRIAADFAGVTNAGLLSWVKDGVQFFEPIKRRVEIEDFDPEQDVATMPAEIEDSPRRLPARREQTAEEREEEVRRFNQNRNSELERIMRRG